MLDHIGFAVSDLARSKAFYEQALAPLGIELLSLPMRAARIADRIADAEA